MSDRPIDRIDPIDPNNPNDPNGPFEGRLHARVRAYSEHGVRPIDAASIAHQVAAPRRRPWVALAARRGAAMGLGAVAIALVAVVALATLPGGHEQPGVGGVPSATPGTTANGASDATPTPAPTPTPTPATCTLVARITSWTGAAGHRLATVSLVNQGVPCHVSTTAQVELIDANGTVLIRGPRAEAGDVLTLATGESLTTEVDDDNYCGDIPIPPVTLAFVWPNGTRTVADPGPATSLGGVPPCLGDPGSAGHISMKPWQR